MSCSILAPRLWDPRALEQGGQAGAGRNPLLTLERQSRTQCTQGIGNSPCFISTGPASDCNKVLTLQPLKTTLSTPQTLFCSIKVRSSSFPHSQLPICPTCSRNLSAALAFPAERFDLPERALAHGAAHSDFLL